MSEGVSNLRWRPAASPTLAGCVGRVKEVLLRRAAVLARKAGRRRVLHDVATVTERGHEIAQRRAVRSPVRQNEAMAAHVRQAWARGCIRKNTGCMGVLSAGALSCQGRQSDGLHDAFGETAAV